jgi:MATE family multidrug resistance protein
MASDQKVSRQLWSLTWPLILASSSTCLLSLTGRYVLAHYSPTAFNTHVGVIVWHEVLQSVLLNLIFIISVFVGHHNGRKQFTQIGPAVWQMLWLSLGVGLLLIPLLWKVAPRVLAANLRADGVPYLRVYFLSMPFYCAAFGAIGSFFTGRKISYAMPLLFVFSHSLNILLTLALVFGKAGFPECGLMGCALATLVAQVCSLLVVFPIFLSRHNRETFHTGRTAFSPRICWRYARFGLPSSLNSLINGVAWCWIIQVVVDRIPFGEFSALGIIFSLQRILSLLSESLGKGNCVLIANFLGEKQAMATLRATLSAAVRLCFLLHGLLLLLIWVFCREFVSFFMGPGQEEIFSLFRQMLPWASLLALMEGIWFQLHYSLTAFKDTPFLTSVNVGSHFLFLIIPAYFLLNGAQPHAVIILKLAVLHQLVRSLILRWRYGVQVDRVSHAEEF